MDQLCTRQGVYACLCAHVSVHVCAWLKCLLAAWRSPSHGPTKKVVLKASTRGWVLFHHTTNQTIHHVNTDLIRQCTLLPFSSCLLSDIWRLTDTTQQYETETGACFCLQDSTWAIFLHYKEVQQVDQVSPQFSFYKAGQLGLVSGAQKHRKPALPYGFTRVF